MMKFRAVNTAITTVLGAAAAGRFQTVGYESQGVAAVEIQNNKRIVQSYYSQGAFPKSGGSLSGPKNKA